MGNKLRSSDIREIEFLAKFYESELFVVRVHTVNSRLLIVINCNKQITYYNFMRIKSYSVVTTNDL